MRDELNDRIINDFPNLYRDKNAPPTESLICFGIEASDGWFQLIYELSMKLEKEILNSKPSISIKLPYINWYKIKLLFKYKQWHGSPFYMRYALIRLYSDWLAKNVAKVLAKIFGENNVIYKSKQDLINTYHATQVKSKFGGLRFYGTFSDKMQKIIDKYESRSYHTCEMCGEKGREVNMGWIYTVCETCEKKIRDNKERIKREYEEKLKGESK
jgi:hypothetical protein